MGKRRSVARKKKGEGILRGLSTIFKVGFVLVCVALACGVGYIGAYLWGEMQDLPDVTLVERYEPIEAIQIFDKFDHLVCTVEGDEDRRVIPLNQVSTQMQQAILAAEDHDFYEHNGINIKSILRAMRTNIKAGHVVEGGSTITQQLVKNLFFTKAGRTYDRKLKEAYMAYSLESKYDKERILEMYLNQIYFGNNAYGIERAAKRYFDKRAAELNLAESAFLAGLVKAPSDLGSKRSRDRAFERQRDILAKMVEYGYITPEQAKEAKERKLVFKKGRDPLQKYPYYISYVMELLRERFSQAELRRQGLHVYTNLDPVAQELGEKVLNERIAKAPKGVSQGALVSITVQDGSVIALVGGVGDFWKNQFNRATHPHTAGSSFKPFVYLTAFLRGVYTPNTIVEDTPLVIKQKWGLPDYAPKNFDHKYMGKIPVRKALMFSRNVPSVRTAQLLGMESIVETARQAGITSRLDPNLSLALGSSAISPLDMACAYSTLARAGVKIPPQILRKIENNRGQVIEVFEPKVDKVFGVEPVARLVSIMQDVVQKGTGVGARLKDRPVAGKTGTADEGRDIWFNGFTPDLVTIVWAGNDENKPIKGRAITGGGLMAPIWREYMEGYYLARPHPAGSFIAPTPTIDEPPDAIQPADNEQLAGAGSAESKPVDMESAPDDEGSHIKETSPNIQPPPLDPLLYPVGASNQETSQNQSQFQPAPKPAPAFAPATGSGAPLPGGTQVPQLAPARVKTNKAPSPAPDVTPHNDSLLDL
ncbi:MAG: PBP1A family penicillin-binding protein [Candidatus Obscuribacterales bacterium]|nr:PBP1A family penicillin-binding protein [Candidatus Obscuribacterales bacterium]